MAKTKGRTRGASKATIGAFAIVVVAVAAVGAYYVAGQGPSPCAPGASKSSAGPASHAVLISEYPGSSNSANPPGYSPDTVTVVIGVNNTVTWTNNDAAAHTVTSTSTPAGTCLDSGNMGSGAAYSYTFTVPGTYKYDCKYHSWMTGTIVVEAAR